MESLLDEVDSLLAPGLSTDNPDWCSNCQSLKQEIKKLQDEQLQNFTKLKQKIISTDLLIKKYKSKCDDYDVQCKKTEEANKRADKTQTQCEILQTQLKAALLDVEPLRATKITLEAEVRLKDTEIQSLSDRLLAVESARQQYEYLSKTNSMDIEKLQTEKKDLMVKMKSLQSRKLTKEASKEYRNEIASLKKDKAALVKNEKRLESKLAAANIKIEKLSNIIKDRKLSPKRRIRTASGNLSSPLKSPSRSPRGLSPRHDILSPLGHSRSQTLGKKKSELQATDVMPPLVNEKLASESSSSSDDTDDDNMSVCSVKWTFSPLMKCLSPLPPSPACFAERKRGDSEEMEDEGEVSDIADILEQQLLEEDTPCQVQHDEVIEKITENVTEASDESSKIIMKDQENEDNATSVNHLIEPDDQKETIVTSKITKEVTDCGNAQNSVEGQFPSVENRIGEQTLKEKLANSLDIISPTAVRKRISYQSHLRSDSHKSLKFKTLKDISSSVSNERKDVIHGIYSKSNMSLERPAVSKSVRINSQKESETEELVSKVSESMEEKVEDGFKKTCESEVKTSTVGMDIIGTDVDIHSSKEKAELNRNDTEEFTPVSESLSYSEVISESLSDSDVDIKPNSISKEMSEIGENHSTVGDKKLSKNAAQIVVSSQVINVGIKINEAKHVIQTKCESIISSPNKNDSYDTEVKQVKETVQVKADPVPKSCLQKLGRNLEEASPCIVNKSASVERNENRSKKELKKFGFDKFINFQKSSSGTLSNEIDDYSYVGDYEVLDRNDKDSKKFSIEIGRMQRKNVTRRLRRTCKYRDLDSEVINERKEVVMELNEEQELPKSKVVEYRKKKSEGNFVLDKTDEVEKSKFEPECKLHVNGQIVTYESDKISTELSSEVLQITESNKDTEDTKCSRKQDVTVSTETKFDNIKICEDIEERELEESNNNCEKLTTDRQMSTGFTVNTPTLERAPSTDSAVSFGTSPSRLFTLESSSCGTIVEEEIDENLNNGDNGSKSEINSDSNFIYGVEDLLDCKQRPLPVSLNSENAQNQTKSVCDNNSSSANIGNTLTIGRTYNNYTGSSLCTFAHDDKDNKPGCSYRYQETSVLIPSKEAPNDTVRDKDSFPKRVPFISETLLHDDSSSRSSIQSITSIDRASPVSPLSLSPFDFLNPISPLPPSPIREIDRVSPLSPEHLAGDQNVDVEDNEPEFAKNSEEDIDEKIKVDNIDKKLIDKNDYSPALCVKALVKDCDVLKKGEKSRNIQTVSVTEILESVKGVENSLESIKNIQKPTGIPEKEAYSEKESSSSDVSLKFFSLPQMISPVKTPKSSAKTKLEQIKSSKNITKLITQKDQIDPPVPILRDEVDRCIKGGPKQFVTKAPVTAITVKPRLTRGRTSIDKTNIEICIRKSSRTALKRMSPVGKFDSSKAKTISSDNNTVKGMQTCQTGSDITSLKSESLTNAEKVTESVIVSKPLENIPNNNADLLKDKDKVSNAFSTDEKGDNKGLEEYTLSHDNLAFKRKTRVAHKPSTNHPVKLQKKIQIIDAPALPPVTVGRKRKSLDNNKEPHEKKKSKEGCFKTQKSSSSDKTITQETKKKMQAFLKSSETAQCFVTKFSTQPCEATVRSDLLSACLECLGRVQTDTLDVVYHICENSQYLNIEYPFSFISDVEKKAVELIQYMCTELKSDGMEVMKKIWDCVFSRDISANIVGKMAQCRVFIALCSLQEDVEQARALFYHIVTCSHLNCTQFVVSVISVWPEVLKKDPSDSPDKVVSHGMTLVLEEVVTKLLKSPTPLANNKILVILQKLCGWSGTANNADTILKLLCNRMLSLLEMTDTDKSGLLELRLALELLCTSQTWAWFKEQFIMRNGLQTASNKYLSERITTPVPPEYMCEMLKLTSRGLYTYSSVIKGREYQQIIRNWLLPLLKHKQDNLKVQECCVETMIELSPLYPDVLKSIHNWFTEKNDVSRELTTRLEYLRLQYKQKTGLLCEPFVKT